MAFTDKTESIEKDGLEIAGLSKIVGYVFILGISILTLTNVFIKATGKIDIYLSVFLGLCSMVLFLFALKQTLKKLTLEKVEINNHAWSFENFVEVVMLCRLDDGSMRRIANSIVLRYISGDTLYLPKNLVGLICTSKDFYNIFRNEILEKLEYLTDRQKEDWFVLRTQNINEIDKLISERRVLEDLLRLLDDTNRIQNRTDFQFANFQAPTVVSGAEPGVPSGSGSFA